MADRAMFGAKIKIPSGAKAASLVIGDKGESEGGGLFGSSLMGPGGLASQWSTTMGAVANTDGATLSNLETAGEVGENLAANFLGAVQHDTSVMGHSPGCPA